MISIPVFRAHLRVAPITGEGVLLLSERDAFALRDRAYRHVVPLIDGRRSSEDIVAALGGVLDPATAWYALIQLEAAGHIAESGAGCGRGDDAFWLTLGAEPAAAAAALGEAEVRIFAGRRTLAERCGAALEQFGAAAPAIGTIGAAMPGGPGPGLDIVLADDYLAEDLRAFDEAARAAGRRWLLARPAAAEIWIGPLFPPDRSPCLRCLQHRLALRRPAHRLAAAHDPERGAWAPPGGTPAVDEAGCLLTAAEAAKALAGIEPGLAGAVWSLDLRDRGSRRHRLTVNPACPVCGPPPAKRAAPPELRGGPVAFDSEGGHRVMPPEQMLRAHEHLISPITGVLGSLTAGPTIEGVGRSYLADDVVGESSDSLGHLMGRFRGSSSGKGVSDAQALASALGEAVERYSAQLHGTESKVPGAFSDFGGEAIHPNSVMNFSDRQYLGRLEWNARHEPTQYVPEPFDPDARIDWTHVWSLTGRRHRLLPTGLLYYGPDPSGGRRDGGRFCVSCTNGCASGSTLEEAVLQAVLELVERDAAAMWWYNRLRRPAVDLDSFGDPWLSGLAARYDTLGRGIAAIDLTNDVGIPVFAGLSHRRRGDSERILIGLGCHLDARIALQRALTEMCQMLAADLQGGGAAAALGNGWMDWATREDHPYLEPDDAAPARGREDFPAPRRGDLLESIEFCRRRIEACGMEMLVLDQTRVDTGMPAVRVVVPGLRHFWARFGPGRLYDVPVALGWRAAPVAEEDLNPVPFIW